jgi:hypothetical protein
VSATVTVVDPTTHKVLELNVRRQNGKTTIAELPAHLHLENASPARFAHLANFSRAAQETFGETGFVDGVPVTAAHVGEKTRGDGRKKRPGRDARQAYLKSLIPPETLEVIEKVPKGQRVQFGEYVSPFFAPRSIRQATAGIPPLP